MFGDRPNLSGLEGLYCGPAALPADIWANWNFDPIVFFFLALLTFLLGRSRASCAAIICLSIAFISPLCALSASLFSARVVHHLLLVSVAAPLIAIAFPARQTTALPLPLLLSTAVLWLWHLPMAYDLAMADMAVYWLMQITLLASATYFWRPVFAADQSAFQSGLAVLGAYIQMGLLGALLTFAPHPLYEIHRLAPLAWGYTPLADQQLGGIIMWVPAGITYAVIGAFIALRGWRKLQVTPTC